MIRQLFISMLALSSTNLCLGEERQSPQLKRILETRQKLELVSAQQSSAKRKLDRALENPYILEGEVRHSIVDTSERAKAALVALSEHEKLDVERQSVESLLDFCYHDFSSKEFSDEKTFVRNSIRGRYKNLEYEIVASYLSVLQALREMEKLDNSEEAILRRDHLTTVVIPTMSRKFHLLVNRYKQQMLTSDNLTFEDRKATVEFIRQHLARIEKHTADLSQYEADSLDAKAYQATYATLKPLLETELTRLNTVAK